MSASPITTTGSFVHGSNRFDGKLGRQVGGKILIASDDATHRDLVSSFLLNRGQTFVTAESMQTALDHLRNGGIDLVITNFTGPEDDGLELMRQVRQFVPGLPVILIASAGADHAGNHLDTAIGLRREVLNGAEDAFERLARLTPRERQVLDLIVTGRSNKLIAYELSISTRTVENHRARIMEKLRIKSVAELVRLSLSADEHESSRIRLAANASGASAGLSTRLSE
jgi:FixJ family two-component response regulator